MPRTAAAAITPVQRPTARLTPGTGVAQESVLMFAARLGQGPSVALRDSAPPCYA